MGKEVGNILFFSLFTGEFIGDGLDFKFLVAFHMPGMTKGRILTFRWF